MYHISSAWQGECGHELFSDLMSITFPQLDIYTMTTTYASGVVVEVDEAWIAAVHGEEVLVEGSRRPVVQVQLASLLHVQGGDRCVLEETRK